MIVHKKVRVGKLGNFGTAFCTEFDTANDRLGIVIDYAKKQGVPDSNPTLAAAVKFFYKEDSALWGTAIAIGSACQNLVAEAVNLTNALNRELAKINKPQVTVTGAPAEKPSEGPGELLTTIKYLAFAGIAAAGIYAFMQVKTFIPRRSA